MKYSTLILLAAVFLAGCGLVTEHQHPYELPMYVGIEKSGAYKLTEKDKVFMHKATSAYFVDLEKASIKWVIIGFQNLTLNEPQLAMNAFNKAWLLNPNNPKVYWGFTLALWAQNEYCKAQYMADRAYSKRLRAESFLLDVAFTYTACAFENKAFTEEQRKKRLAWAEDLFKKTFSSRHVDKEYALLQWARALIVRGDTEGAKKKIFALEKITGKKYKGELLLQLNRAPAEPKK